MKLHAIDKVMGGILGATLLLGIHSCTDDHFDIKTELDAKSTIWQQIEKNDQLKDMKYILSNVKVYTKEEDTRRSMTYAELLNRPQSFTFWAPLDGSYDSEAIKANIDKVAELNKQANEAEKSEDADKLRTQANQLEYTVGQQFIQNHLARFNFESNLEPQEIRLFNNKLVVYDAGKGDFNGAKMSTDYPMKPSSNGVLHILESESVFSPNIFDYLGVHSDEFQNVYGTLSDPAIDKRIFSESLSTPGGMNSQGEMVYVDSVFITNNELLNESGALIKNEDSLYVAIIPTDNAWAEATEKVGNLMNYGSVYNYDYTDNALNFARTLKLDGASQNYETKADSLKQYNTSKLLITSMYFSPSIFREQYGRNEIDQIKDYVLHADSLISTNGVTYYNQAGKGAVNPVFAHADVADASNGIIYKLNSYEIDPAYAFVAKQNLEMSNTYNVGSVQGTSTGNKGQYVSLVEGNNLEPELAHVVEGMKDKVYRWFAASGNLQIYVPIQDLFSTKYKISIQMLPNNVDINHQWPRVEEDATDEDVEEGEGDEDAEPNMVLQPQESRFYCELFSDEGKRIGTRSEDIVVSDTEIKTYTIWDEIEIPKCYVGLPSGVNNCYPMLRINMPRGKVYQPGTSKGYTSGLSIIKIIVEPVR